MGALDRVRVLLASEVSARLRQIVDAPFDLFTLGGERDRACVEVLDALQLPRGQRPHLGTQLLDVISQLAQALCARDRRGGLCACARLLLTRFSWDARCAGCLGVAARPAPGSWSIARSSSSRSSIRRATRASSSPLLGCWLSCCRVRTRSRSRGVAVVVDQQPGVAAGAGERGVAPAARSDRAALATTIACSTVPPCMPWPVSA